ncbi:MAG: divalent-cation tolerance protein CutA [Thioalkalispiraceae bacterium]
MDTPDTTHKILMTTLPDEDQARDIAEMLVTEKLAACINILPMMTSIYEWEGKVEQGEEHLLLIKTDQHSIEAIQNVILDVHPYELPEIVVVPIVGGYEPYLKWISESVQ